MAEDLTRFLAAYDTVLDRWPIPIDRMDLTSAYGTTRVTACGPEHGKPLVLLHSGNTTSAVWFANAADLSRTRRIYAVDRIGEAGHSLRGDHPIRSTEDLLEWLDCVLHGLGLGRPMRPLLRRVDRPQLCAARTTTRTQTRSSRPHPVLRRIQRQVPATRPAHAHPAHRSTGSRIPRLGDPRRGHRPRMARPLRTRRRIPRPEGRYRKTPTGPATEGIDHTDTGIARRRQPGAQYTARRGSGAASAATRRDRSTPRRLTPRNAFRARRRTEPHDPGLGAFYRSALYRLLGRINAYLLRWVRNKYRRLKARRKAHKKWNGITQRYPPFLRALGLDFRSSSSLVTRTTRAV
jgi:hypothetical protein